MKVFLNPGHDLDYDSGAVSPRSGLRECDVAAHVGTLVKHYLEAAGCTCNLMQSDNLAPTSTGRSRYADRQGPTVTETANDWDADIFVSIHCNSAEADEACGTETFAYDLDGGEGEKLATCIQDQIVDALNAVDRGVKANPKLFVLRYTAMPAVLVELGFISNESDEALLTDRQDDFARAIARGVTDYEQTLA
ncbi:N-acetylmuramoyl-L-alanine amidase [uncultured Mitsuokella sp.]|uniref:N-acetylmuramoyl-L-alanine amidase family protein n=1 Tax=uncultured Mitsuokella sp. TaxID=453120 RepID=UPI00259495FD|nr:N-acetylmuramoyl-L-alanine amidase [uncultured Mitsuokella sp.]